MPNDHVRFVVYGDPRPKGSFRAYTYVRSDGTKGARATNDNKRTKSWQSDVANRAREARPRVFFNSDVPVAVDVIFFFARPKTVSVKKRPFVTVKPDLDKLARGVLDGLKGVLYRDDGQVTRCTVAKEYALPGDQSRAEINVWRSAT